MFIVTQTVKYITKRWIFYVKNWKNKTQKLENQGEILKFGEFYGSISLPALSSGKKFDEVEDEEENENPEEGFESWN